jgi:hypothetical protein
MERIGSTSRDAHMMHLDRKTSQIKLQNKRKENQKCGKLKTKAGEMHSREAKLKYYCWLGVHRKKEK